MRKSNKNAAPARNLNASVLVDAIREIVNTKASHLPDGCKLRVADGSYMDEIRVDILVIVDGLTQTIVLTNNAYDLRETDLPFVVYINPSVRLGDLTPKVIALYGKAFTLAAEIADAISASVAKIIK